MLNTKLVVAYDRTTRYVDTEKTIALRKERIEEVAQKSRLDITKFVLDKEPRDFSEQHELHNILEYTRNRQGDLDLIAFSPYRLVKAGLNVLVPIISELHERLNTLVFANPRGASPRLAVEWSLAVKQEMIDERAATIQARREITGRRGAGRPRLNLDVEQLERYAKRHKSIRKAAKLLGISPETARLRLRELQGIRDL